MGTRGWMIGAAVGLALCVAGGISESAASEESVVVMKELTGKISAVAPGFLNVIYKSESERGVDYEMPLRVDEKVEFRLKRGLDEFAFGDMVKVAYAEVQQLAERSTADGKTESYMRVVSRTATVVTFIKPAAKGMVSGE